MPLGDADNKTTRIEIVTLPVSLSSASHGGLLETVEYAFSIPLLSPGVS